MSNSFTVVRLLIVLFGFVVSGCTTGPMNIEERTYLAVPSGEQTNFYRITVYADTYLGDSTYDSGWFPAYAVDRLYGSTKSTSQSNALKTEQDVQALIDQAIVDTTAGYLEAAKNPATTEESILEWMAAQRRVRAMAGDGVQLPRGAVELEYDPTRNLVVRHSGEKRVFVLASDPDTVIGTIANFANSNETSVTVSRLADVVREQRVSETDQAEAKLAVSRKTDTIIASQMGGMLRALDGMNRDALKAEVDGLLILVEGVR